MITVSFGFCCPLLHQLNVVKERPKDDMIRRLADRRLAWDGPSQLGSPFKTECAESDDAEAKQAPQVPFHLGTSCWRGMNSEKGKLCQNATGLNCKSIIFFWFGSLRGSFANAAIVGESIADSMIVLNIKDRIKLSLLEPQLTS